MTLLANLTTGSPVILASLAGIDATGRLRPVDRARAQLIAASMNESGLIQPVVVRPAPSGNGLKLVVGGHRLCAAEINGWDEIAAILIECSDDEARQIEIDENLARKELTALERAEFLAERKRIYETLHPEAAQGKAKKPKTEKAKVANLATFARFSKDAAKSTGLGERTVQRACELAAALSPEAVALLRGSALADNQSQLQALADLPPEQQLAVAKAVSARPKLSFGAARVAAGLVPEGGAIREGDKLLARVEPILQRLSVAELETVIAMAQAQIASRAPAKPVRAKKGAAA